MDGVSRVRSHVVSGFVSHVGFVFSHFFLGFRRFLDELDQVILFVNGSSESVHGDFFNLFLRGHGETIHQDQQFRVESGGIQNRQEFSFTEESISIFIVSREHSLGPKETGESSVGHFFKSFEHINNLFRGKGGGEDSFVNSSHDIFSVNDTIIEGKREFSEVIEQVSNSDELNEVNSGFFS